MSGTVKGMLVGALVLIVGVAPVVYFRSVYAHSKRLRVVVPGRFYRSGQMTAAGFTDAIAKLHIRTVINVQDDVPDPDLDRTFWNRHTIKESALCRQLGVRFVQLSPDLVPHRQAGHKRPETIEQFLAIMDDERNYPVLIHCRAGLHRTGCLSAVYRMEYEGWSPEEAYRELKAHGFGTWACTSANDYVQQYVLTYHPDIRNSTDPDRAAHVASLRAE
jgi:tyrosine-protein phosphatase SIW14